MASLRGTSSGDSPPEVDGRGTGYLRAKCYVVLNTVTIVPAGGTPPYWRAYARQFADNVTEGSMKIRSRTILAGAVSLAATVLLAATAPTSIAAEEPAPTVNTASVSADADQWEAGTRVSPNDDGDSGGIRPLTAEGCTSAPGNWSALNCIYVRGSKLNVEMSESSYQQVGGGSNVCNHTSQWRYTPYRLAQTTYSKSVSACVPLVRYVTWNTNQSMKPDSSFCARTKNSLTDYAYSPYACITIRG